MSDKSDDDLFLDFVQTGDVSAYAELHTRYWRSSVNYARSLNVDSAAAEDVAQQAWVELDERRTGLQGTDFEHWLFGRIKARVADHFKKQGRRRKRAITAAIVKYGGVGERRRPSHIEEEDWVYSDDATNGEPSDYSRGKELDALNLAKVEAINSAKDKLPEPLRKAIALVYEDGLTREDAAYLLGLSVNGLDKRLQKARDAIRQSEEVAALAL